MCSGHFAVARALVYHHIGRVRRRPVLLPVTLRVAPQGFAKQNNHSHCFRVAPPWVFPYNTAPVQPVPARTRIQLLKGQSRNEHG
jgi:hypothetical protein